MKMNYKRTLLGRDIHTNKHTHQLFQEKGMTKKKREGNDNKLKKSRGLNSKNTTENNQLTN